jgi:very-short-patch-repair endonuclease
VDKLNIITKQLARAENKRFEHYVISRIWHKLDDLTIKFVTQQYVIRPNGRALTDMYFPQFGLHIEVDEPHHLNQVAQDRLRENDIINATNHEILRLDTSKGLEFLNQKIEEVLNIIRQKKLTHTSFKEWNLEMEQNSETYIKRGYIDIADDVSFKTMVTAINCFGHNYEGWQRGGAKHGVEENTLLWFPKLFKNENWNNSITDDESVIYEKSENAEMVEEHIQKVLDSKFYNRIVFAKVKDTLGIIMYRFKGRFILNLEKTNANDGLVWEKVSDRVQTYPSPARKSKETEV